jgi:hypothetical protein
MEASVGGFLKSVRDPSLDSDTSCLTSGGFEFLLERQVAVAQRYGYYFTLVLLRLKSEARTLRRETAFNLVTLRLRRSDYIGRLDVQTIGIILQHATVEIAQGVVERLRSEVVNGFPEFARGILCSSAGYPTEAGTALDLKTLAAKRLIERNPSFSFLIRAPHRTEGTGKILN